MIRSGSRRRPLLALVSLLLSGAVAASQPADPAKAKRLAWFHEAKYGLFIHWGLYAIPAGEWKGKRIPGTRRPFQSPAGIAYRPQ